MPCCLLLPATSPSNLRCRAPQRLRPLPCTQELQGALARARAETEEAIQTHNKKYNDMLAERMRAEDALSEQLDAARRALEAEQRARADVEAQFGDARTRWDQERVAMTEERKVRKVAAQGGAGRPQGVLVAGDRGRVCQGQAAQGTGRNGAGQGYSMPSAAPVDEASPPLFCIGVQASDASWKGKVEALVEEVQREKAAGKDAAKKAADAAAVAAARIQDLEGRLAGVEGQLRDKSGEADRCVHARHAVGQV